MRVEDLTISNFGAENVYECRIRDTHILSLLAEKESKFIKNKNKQKIIKKGV